MEVKKFMLWEMKAYNWKYSEDDTTVLYSALGGIPRYLNMVNPSLDVKDNLYELFFAPGALLSGEVDTLLNEEFKETSRYSDVLSAIASGKSSLNDISEAVGMQSGVATFYLTGLIRVGIIKKEIPYGSKNNKKSIYTIIDGLFRFHYQFVRPNMNMINFGKGDAVLNVIVMPSIPRYMGLEWEQICINYMYASYNPVCDPFIYSNLQRWWGGNKTTKRQCEIDMMSTNDKKALFGECKWNDDKVGLPVLDTLIDVCDQFDYSEKYWYLFSRTGFTDELINKANCKENNLRLISLKDLFSV